MSYRKFSIINKENNLVLFNDVLAPDGFINRARGLLGRTVLSEEQGMLFFNCNAIHMFGMKLPLDIIFINRYHRVEKCIASLEPWRFAVCGNAKITLEVCEGSVKRMGIQKGMNLEFMCL